MGLEEILQCYVPEFEQRNILVETHGGAEGGHYVGKATTYKILRTGLWWPTMHKDSKAYCRACDACQRIGRPSWRDELPLMPQVMLKPFEKWQLTLWVQFSLKERRWVRGTLSLRMST